jgi:RHS repeat-associated protein
VENRFDSAGRPDRDSDSTRTVQYSPDENGNIVISRSVEAAITFQAFVTPDTMDRPEVVADTVGTVSTSRFRADGRVTNVVNALGHSTGFGVSKLGETLATQRPNGVGFRYGFNDHRSKVAARDRSGGGLTSATDDTFRVDRTTIRSGAETRYANFDPRNQRPQAFSGAGVDAILSYDAQGRVTGGRVSYSGIIRDETAGYDALDRVTVATFPGGQSSFEYDLLGPLKSATLSARGAEYLTTRRYRGDGAATRVSYPSPDSVVVDLGRDLAGRPTTVLPKENDPVVASTTYTGARLVGSQNWGTNVIRAESSYDLRGRLIGRRYLRSGETAPLADVRYQYDPADNMQVRQLIHRGGRADVFLYDAGNRLIAAHHGVRPPIELAADRAGYVPFDLPLGADGVWKPGFNTRSYQFDLNGLDTFLGTVLLNPDALPVFAFPTNFAGSDAFLLPQAVDGFARDRDTLGNATRVRLGVWPEGATQPVPVGATLRYDGLNHLVEIARDDGVRLKYEYDHAGLMFERRVEAAGTTTITTLIWDQGRLIAEYDRSGGGNRLLARHHYFGGGDVPVATDRRDTNGGLRRQYYLTDGMGHVMALADGSGRVLSRFEYDAWGQFRPEAPDTAAPRVLRARKTPAGFRLEFSETVLPPGGGAGFPILDTAARSFGEIAEVVVGGETVGGAWQYEESVPGTSFGRTLQFLSSRPLAGTIEVRVREGVALDAWLNPNPAQILAMTLAPGVGDGAILFDEPAPGGPTSGIVRSQFMFQGQYFDYEAGLIYMRARFYDPATGLFLQPDPVPYRDSPNLYAAFRQNPTSLRDPSGMISIKATPRGQQPKLIPLQPTPVHAEPLPRPLPAPPASPKAGGARPLPGPEPRRWSVGGDPEAPVGVRQWSETGEVAPTTARTSESSKSDRINSLSGQHISQNPEALQNLKQLQQSQRNVFNNEEAQQAIHSLREAESSRFKIMSPIMHYSGRDIVAVKLDSGHVQSFYKSTGTSVSELDGAQVVKVKGDWEPFYGLLEAPTAKGLEIKRGHFMKYTRDFVKNAAGVAVPKNPVHVDVDLFLKRLNPEQGIETGIESVNRALRSTGAPVHAKAPFEDF